jgi:hypothetical protein
VFEVTSGLHSAGSPFDDAAKRVSVFFGSPCLRRLALAGESPRFDTKLGELVVDFGFAVAAVGGDGAQCASAALGHPRATAGT